MRIDTDGNVGIGTSSPDSKLAVYSATGTTQLRFGASPNHYWDISRDNDTSGNLWISNYNNSGSRTTRMVIGNTGDINIPTLGARITGDFSNATISNRLMFQTNTTNGNTLVGAVPNGTGNSAGWYAFGGSDPSNAAYAGIASSNGVSIIVSGIIGTGTYQPLIMTTGGSERIRIDTSGNVGIGTGVPGAKLQVVGSSTVAGYNNVAAVFGAGVSSELYVGSLNGTAPFIASGNAYPLLFQTNGSERMRIDANGNVGIGESNPSGWNSKLVIKGASGYVQSAVISTGSTSADVAASTVTTAGGVYNIGMQSYGDGLVQMTLNSAAGKERRTVIFTSNSVRWMYGADGNAESGSNAGSNFFIARFSDNGTYLGQTHINRANGDFVFDTSIKPSTDNLYSSGAGANRWSVVYAGTGTINTSDAREKNEVRSLTENEILAAQALSKEIGAYKFLSSIAEKGDAAREHIGMTVQRAIEVMESFGLNPFNYGFICYDEWDEQTETIPAVEATEAVIGANGEVVVPAREAKPEEIQVIREAGNRYSFRMDELSMFISRGLVARMDSIEAKLAALGA